MPGYQFTPGGIFELEPDGSVPLPKQERGDIGSSQVKPRLPIVQTNGGLALSAFVPPTREDVALGLRPKAISPADVIKLARARLRDVEREIKRCKALEKERDQLRRLLDAADNKPRAVVRELPKRSAG